MNHLDITPDTPDSHLFRMWANQAIDLDRLDMASALLRLAIQARRMEQTGAQAVAVPFVGSTRPETPARLRVVTHNGADGSTAYEAVATMTAPAPSLADAAATQIFGQVAERNLGVPEAHRCTAGIRFGSVEGVCAAVCYWQVGQIGDASHPAVQAGWKHLDPELDQDHEPVIVVN